MTSLRGGSNTGEPALLPPSRHQSSTQEIGRSEDHIFTNPVPRRPCTIPQNPGKMPAAEVEAREDLYDVKQM